MKKFKIKYVKFVFTPRKNSGDDWKTAAEPNIGFGNRHTDKHNRYQFNQNHISVLFSDYLKDDPRKFERTSKFTESEASILLLKYLEDNLKEARKSKKDVLKSIASVNQYGVDKTYQNHMWEYSLNVYNREIKFNAEACKIWRKKVREIKKSPEYLWEQLLK